MSPGRYEGSLQCAVSKILPFLYRSCQRDDVEEEDRMENTSDGIFRTQVFSHSKQTSKNTSAEGEKSRKEGKKSIERRLLKAKNKRQHLLSKTKYDVIKEIPFLEYSSTFPSCLLVHSVLIPRDVNLQPDLRRKLQGDDHFPDERDKGQE